MGCRHSVVSLCRADHPKSPAVTMADLVTSGFAAAFVTYVLVWGLTVPIRYVARMLGFDA